MKSKICLITDKNLWEKFSLSLPFSSIFQSWNMGEAELKQNTKIERLGFYLEDRLYGIAQIKYVVAKRGKFMHIRGGPLFRNWQHFQDFFPLIKERAIKQGASFIRISPPILKEDRKSFETVKNLGFRNVPIPLLDAEVSWVLDLGRGDDELLLNMRKTTRYLIKKAKKIGVVIKKSKDFKSAQDLLELYKIMVEEKHLVPHKGIIEEFVELVKDNQALIFLGYYQKKLLGAALILFYGDEAIYHHSAHIRNDIPVSYLLQWEAIQEAKKRGKKKYNFWGIDPSGSSTHPWAGLTLFKKGFGGSTQEFIQGQDYPLSYAYIKTFLIETIRRITRYGGFFR
ncbi:MAG: aminoacyltransferase [Patescibacteria group bacterium]|nr:aminoacyltransferase [Patescibacteria group bacterium]